MADGKIEIETGINTDGIEKGLGKVKKNLTSIKGLGMSAVIGAEVKALKNLTQGINDTAQAYNKQYRAEKQLETASKNNPFLDNNSVKQLKSFASEMQKISTVGDEQLLPLMSQLASAGRTQSEIQNIVKTALDVSASGMMSLDQAVTQLNATYSGNIGLMGRQISELKGLTKEELESGKAVEILAEKFKGMSEEVTNASGSYEQMKNAQGDFKEALGTITKPSSDLWNKFWKGWYERGIENINNIDKALDKSIAKKNINKWTDFINTDWTDANGKTVGGEKRMTEEQLLLVKEIYETRKKDGVLLSSEENQALIYINKELRLRKEIAKENEEERKKQEELLKVQQAQKNADEKAQASINKYKQTVEDAQKEIEFRRQLGEEISQESEDQELLNVKTQAWIQMIKDSEGTISGQKGFAKEESERIAKEVERLQMESAFDETKELVESWQTQKDESLQAQLEMLQNYEDYLSKKESLTEQDIEMQEKIKDAKSNINSAMLEEQNEKFQESLEQVQDFLGQFSDITSGMTDLVRNANEKETQEELSSLSKQYTDGLISYEEYCAKKEEIDKASAQKEYQLKMWEYGQSILTATMNVAQGVSKAIAQGGVLGIVQGALVSLAGMTEIATIRANKPTPPKFATGGIVGGSSYSGDHVVANVNSGEMILNASQQKQLWNMANGSAGGGAVVNMPIKIENNASDSVRTNATMTNDGIRIVVDKLVNASMQQGRYDSSMQYANNKRQGVSVL